VVVQLTSSERGDVVALRVRDPAVMIETADETQMPACWKHDGEYDDTQTRTRRADQGVPTTVSVARP
jgi:hypothetical protein